jgi:Kyakuja-Dileera-Zisupton transposase
MPESLRLNKGNVEVSFGVPKFHIPAHKLPCQAPHSLNLMLGVGRTDGEGIERNWAEINAVANSTKEMGPGSRHDTLDDHFGHHNWRKYVGFGG